jgi:hypothetical protein
MGQAFKITITNGLAQSVLLFIIKLQLNFGVQYPIGSPPLKL